MATSKDITRAGIGTGISAVQRGGEQVLKIIDISDQPLKPNVVRKGKQVPFVDLDRNIIDAIISPDVIVQPGESPRVVSQSIPVGTKVARGASVDLVLAPRAKIPGGIFRGGHAGFSKRNVEDMVAGVLADDLVFAAVVDFDDPAQLPVETRRVVEAALQQAEIPINEGNSTQDFAAAFRSLKGAAAYK